LVSITSPLSGVYVTRKGIVKINVTASDLSGISKIEIYLDNKILKTCTNVTTCSYNQNAGKLTLGVHYITAIAYDKAGNFKLTDPAVVINRR